MRSILASLIMFCMGAISANADPALKVINFTADWCPNCVALNPRIDEAMSQFPEGEITRIDLDMTAAGPGSSDIQKIDTAAIAIRLAHTHQARYLWDWYGGATGIAVVIAADNGEPLSCIQRPMKSDEIAERLELAKILATSGQPGARKPDGPDCPPPTQ
ncbi:MAG: hypothetical protein Hens3KO_17710 [Henriciella sp.]